MEDYFGDIDIEELESRLYSQVYHTTSQDPEEPIPSLTFVNNNQKNRYYQPYDKSSTGLPINQDRTGRFSANLNADKSSADNSFQIVLNPINNFLVVPGPNSKETNKRRKQNSRRSKRSKERFFRKNSELQMLEKKEKSILTMQKKVNKFDKLISLFKNKKSKNKKHKDSMPNSNLPSQVIHVSDTDNDDDCVMVPEKRPFVCVSDSDSDSKVNANRKSKTDQKTQVTKSIEFDDDVIYVAPPPVEIICVDAEDDDESAKLISNKSFSVNNDSIAEALPVNQSDSVSELVQTGEKEPANESNTSNDFLESSTAVTDSNFNFGLHGSDFNGEFIRPANPCEAYESASSSTSDFNPPLKAVVFNTIDFPREDLFSEGNLDNFSQLITPKRNSLSDSVPENVPIDSTSKKDKVTSNDASSDSSSESDYDSASVKNGTKRKLPDLSNMNCEGEVSKSSKKKNLNTPSLDDEQVFTKKSLKRKSEVEETPKKKSKKKRTNVSMTENISLSEDNQNTSALLDQETVLRRSPKFSKSNDQFDKNDSQPTIDCVKEFSTPQSRASATKVKNKTRTKTDEALKSSVSSDLPQVKSLTPQSKSPKLKNKETVKNQSEIKSQSHGASSEKEAHVDNSYVIINKDPIVICSPEHEPVTELELNFVSKGDSELEENISKSQKRLNFSDCWSPDKRVFYSTPVDVTNCDIRTIQNTMSDDPGLWKISYDDRFPKPTQNRGPRCLRCRNFGHLTHKCPKRSMVCSTCGEDGHLHNSCRLFLCKQCGEYMRHRGSWCNKCFLFRNKFCTICRIRGHSNTVCPDLWRRYHLTTKKGPLIKAKNKGLKPSNQLWCSACAKSGHLEASCSQSSEPQSVMHIKSYDDVYDSQECPASSEPSRQVKDSKETNSVVTSLPSDMPNTYPASVSNQRTVPDHNSVEPLCSNDEQNNTSGQENNLAKATTQSSSINSNSIDPLIGSNTNPIFNLGNLGSMLLTNLQSIQNALMQVPQTLSNIPLLNYQNRIPIRDQSNEQVLSRRNLSVANTFSSNLSQNDDVYQIINFQPIHVVQEFLKSELLRLQNFSCDAVFLGRKMSQLESIVTTKPYCRNDLAQLYMKFNMLVFGKHRFQDGNKHVHNLERFKECPTDHRLGYGKRKQLWESYNYIFGKAKHTHNPYRFLRIIENRT